MGEKANPAWVFMERLQRLKAASFAAKAEDAYQDCRAMLAWVADVERRLPQPQSPPRPRDTNTAAIERAVAVRDAAAAKLPTEAEPTAELCSKHGVPLHIKGDWRTCIACAQSWRVRPGGRPQSAWVVDEPSEPAPDQASELIQLRERVHFLDAMTDAQEAALSVAKATIEARDAEIARLRVALKLRDGEVLP